MYTSLKKKNLISLIKSVPAVISRRQQNINTSISYFRNSILQICGSAFKQLRALRKNAWYEIYSQHGSSVLFYFIKAVPSSSYEIIAIISNHAVDNIHVWIVFSNRDSLQNKLSLVSTAVVLNGSRFERYFEN